MRIRLLLVYLILLVAIHDAGAQEAYLGASFGFRSYGLKGAATIAQGGQIGQLGNYDCGKTTINFGLSGGYQILPASVADGWYKLDLNLDASFSSVPFVEQGFNYVNGSGSWAANGFSGGTTKIISFDIMPIHRLNIPKFKLLSPYAGLGFTLNLMFTSDITQTQQGNPQAANWKGNSEMKMGLLIYYGTLVRASDQFQPFVQFKHLIAFGSETQFTSDAQNGNLILKDIPGYFSIVGGVRFVLN